MDLRQILITIPIENAVQILNPKIDLSIYTRQKGEQGFPLVRIDDMDKKTDPVILTPVPNMGKKIDGTMKQVYTIVDGRHRIAYAISNGKLSIPAFVQ